MAHTKIYELRAKAGLRREHIAWLLCIPLAEYRRYEVGSESLPVHLAQQLAAYYHVPVQELLDGIDTF